MKLLIAVQRAEHASPAEFATQLLTPPAAGLIERYVVNLLNRTGRPPMADALIEVKLPEVAGRFADIVGGVVSLGDVAGATTGYRVEERVILDYERDWPDGEPSPGVKAVFFANRIDSLSRAEFDDYWATRHAPLALKHHIGLWRYVQNAVTEHTGSALPDVDGLAEPHFRTQADFEERFFDSPEGVEAIRRDVARFGKTQGVSRHLMTEHILIGGPASGDAAVNLS